MVQAISKFIFTTLLGWKLEGTFPKNLKKYIIIGAPHTSWKDFPISVLARSVANIKVNFIAKDSLFKPPFGFIFRWLGGAPVDRSKSTNLVDATVDVFNSREEFRLALSPEGTRQRTEKWKTGFYYIAKGAKIPVVMFAFDFKHKTIRVAEPYTLTGDMQVDFDHFLNFYKDVVPAKPELFNNENLL